MRKEVLVPGEAGQSVSKAITPPSATERYLRYVLDPMLESLKNMDPLRILGSSSQLFGKEGPHCDPNARASMT